MEVCQKETAELMHSTYASDTRVYYAILDILWYNGPVNLMMRGTHMEYTSLTTVHNGIEHEFNLDNEDDKGKLVTWAQKLRDQKVGDPKPGP